MSSSQGAQSQLTDGTVNRYRFVASQSIQDSSDWTHYKKEALLFNSPKPLETKDPWIPYGTGYRLTFLTGKFKCECVDHSQKVSALCDTPINDPAYGGAFNIFYTSIPRIDFVAPATGTYTLTYPPLAQAVYHVLSTSDETTVITHSISQTPDRFFSGDSISLTAGDHLYLMPVGNNGQVLDLTISW